MKGIHFLGTVKKNILFFGLAVALLINLAVGLITYYNLNKLYKTDIQENNTYKKIIKLEELFSYLKDAETARRGYILTGQERFLEPYNNALPMIDKLKNETRAAALNQADQKRRLIVIDSLIKKKIGILKDSIELMKREGYDEEPQIAFTIKGKGAMDEIRKTMDEMIETENRIIEKWSLENSINKRNTALIIILGYSLSFMIICLIFFQLNHQISIRKRTEDNLKKALKVKSDFTSMVSHELRTPLTAIKEGIGIVLDGSAGEINEEQEDFLNTAKRNVDRLARLINNVLDFQKLESDKAAFNIKEQDINEAINEAWKAMLHSANNKGLDFTLELDSNLPKVKFDKDKIMQVLANLINNAIKFTPQGIITIITCQADNSIQVSVQDTGPGIREEDTPKLFQEFSQIEKDTERKTGGSGLGLAISKKIIDAHKGKIWVESEFGRGTTIHFALPVKERRA